jgi:hypothetical protein
MVEGFRWLVQLAAGRGFGRGTALVMTALVEPTPLALLPVVVVWCLVRCVVRVFCSCAVALASACDVKLLLLLI